MSGSDRQLLELAAKAAGYNLIWSGVDPDLCWLPGIRRDYENCWNPLTDDGDALRLAVSLSIYLQIHHDQVTACLDCQHFAETLYENECMNIATRRAIVRAASEIGRSMP